MNQSKIAKLRKDKSLTQENLAEKACVTVRTIQRIEAGEEVSSETLKNISNALDVTINELFESIASSDKEEEIMEIAKEQQKQFHYRRNEQLTFRFIAFGVIFVFLGMMHYVLNVLISKKLDEKYPMTVGMNNKRSNMKQQPVKNGWEFMARYWWIIFPIGGFLSWLIPELTGK